MAGASILTDDSGTTEQRLFLRPGQEISGQAAHRSGRLMGALVGSLTRYACDSAAAHASVERHTIGVPHLHLNALQEALQPEGDTNFSGLLVRIEGVCRSLSVPVVAKEVGWGISQRTARLLADCGVGAIDVAGAGGTSWSQVEMHRAPDEFTRQLASTFAGWGIPTADSILNVKNAAPGVKVIASGGLKDGLDIAKCLALGATLGGMAGQFLKAAVVAPENAAEIIRLLRTQIQIIMFATAAKQLGDLSAGRISKQA